LAPTSSRTAAARFGTPSLVYARLRYLDTVAELSPNFRPHRCNQVLSTGAEQRGLPIREQPW